MGFVTDGDTEDFGTVHLRRPISVAQLLEREGYRPAIRSSAARRALSGVAAGAVLSLGAVVGSLFLNHGDRTTGDIAAAGLAQSGGDIVLAESNTSTGSAPAAASAAATDSHVRHHQPAPNTTKTQPTHSTHPKTTHQARPANTATTNTATTRTTATTRSAPTATTQSLSNTVTTAPAATQPTTQQPTTTQPSTTQPTTTQPTTTDQSTTQPPTTTQQGNGGVLGDVGQVLGNVTQPVFNWFG